MKIIAFITLVALAPPTMGDYAWKMVKSGDDIKVYKMPTNEGYNAIKIEAQVNVELADFVKFINDADNYKNWVYSCSDSKLISKNENVLYYETTTNMPFPVQDRYLKVKSTQILQDKLWESHSVGLGAEKEYLVAINHFDSRWRVEQVSPKQISIQYTVRTEPGGFIPAWLYNLAVDKGPYNTMVNLKRILESKSDLVPNEKV